MSSSEIPIRIPMSCLAETITRAGRSLKSLLGPYKFQHGVKGVARTTYYQPALRIIRDYHRSGNSREVLNKGIFELKTRENSATNRTQRKKFAQNIEAIEAYHAVYGGRRFRLLPCRCLLYQIGSVTVKAQPDLWVEEGKEQVLLKIGMARHGTSYIDIMLSLLRKAAVSNKYKIRAKNFVYLNVKTGKEMICSGGLVRFNRTFKAASDHIAQIWPGLSETERPQPSAS